MISSTPRLNKLVELVTKAIITLSSTPDSASLTTSDTGPVSLMLGGRAFPVEIGLTDASASAASSASSPRLASSLAAAGASASVFASGSNAGGGVLVACPDARCGLPPPKSSAATLTPKPHLQRIRLFISRYGQLSIIASLTITIRLDPSQRY